MRTFFDFSRRCGPGGRGGDDGFGPGGWPGGRGRRGGPFGGGPFGGGGFGGGGRRERMFESGDLRLVVLHVLKQQPSHGYEVIKAIADLVGGDYSPSPGTVYPTLTLLEDLGQATVADTAGGRKQYAITEAGEAHLAEHQATLERLLARLTAVRTAFGARRSPALERAMQNLKLALKLRFDQGEQSEEQLRRIAEVIDRAAVEIERL